MGNTFIAHIFTGSFSYGIKIAKNRLPYVPLGIIVRNEVLAKIFSMGTLFLTVISRGT
jgi:hypothetical protein